MAYEVFKIVNNIASPFIQNIRILKYPQYSLRKDKIAVVPKDVKIWTRIFRA